MSFFKKRNHDSSNSEKGNNGAKGPNKWESTADVPYAGNKKEAEKSAEQLDDERQQRKILAAYALGEKSYGSIISFKEPNVGDDVLEKGMERVANGQVPLSEKKAFLSRILSPIYHEANHQNVVDSLETKHQQRILGYFGTAGFGGYDNISAKDIKTFRDQYPTPADFEDSSANFLNMIERHNGEQKRKEYERAMDAFKHKVYGKQYEYWNQMKEIDKIAGAFSESQEIPDDFERDRRNSLMLDTRYETERNAEWIPGDTGVYQTSKHQAIKQEITPSAVWAGEVRSDIFCQDAYFKNSEQQLFGVFDGVGGSEDGRGAAMSAERTVGQLSAIYNMSRPEHLASALNKASENIIKDGLKGSTTGALARVVNYEGVPSLVFAAAGDSRIYVVDVNGQARLITHDEGVGNRIYNYLGRGRDTVTQYGAIPLSKGDKIVICSDGITGDFAPDLMSDERLGSIVHHSRNAEDAAKNLTIEASKKDDRTAIVFAPDFSKL